MLPKLPFQVSTSSRQLLSGNHQNNVNSLLTSFGQVTALAGGALSTLTPVINNAFTELAVANNTDSVVLPVAKVGLRCCISNPTGNSAQVFANGTDTINGTAGNVGVALAGGAVAMYVCTKDGVWRRFVSA